MNILSIVGERPAQGLLIPWRVVRSRRRPRRRKETMKDRDPKNCSHFVKYTFYWSYFWFYFIIESSI